MSRRTKHSALWLIFLAVFAVLLAMGATLAYMSMVAPRSEIVGEVNTGGGEMAGVNILYTPRIPLWILVRASVDSSKTPLPTTVGPTTLGIYVNGQLDRTITCGQRTVNTPSFYLCSFTDRLYVLSSTPTASIERSLPDGRNTYEVWIISTTVGGREVTNVKVLTLVIDKTSHGWYIEKIEYNKVSL